MNSVSFFKGYYTLLWCSKVISGSAHKNSSYLCFGRWQELNAGRPHAKKTYYPLCYHSGFKILKPFAFPKQNWYCIQLLGILNLRRFILLGMQVPAFFLHISFTFEKHLRIYILGLEQRAQYLTTFFLF